MNEEDDLIVDDFMRPLIIALFDLVTEMDG